MNKLLSIATLSAVVGCSLIGQAPMAEAAQSSTNQAPAVQASMEVRFQDAQLEQAIKKHLNKSDTEAVSQQDMESLTSIHLTSDGITSLEGLQYATNLTYLTLFHNEIEDISPLGALTKLRGLDLRANRIASIEALATLTNIEELQLSGNRIASIEAVKRFPRLRHFEANDNEIADLQPLSTATQLEVLEVGDNRIADFKPISTLPKLAHLNISNNRLSSLSVLKPLSQTLRALRIGGSRISDLRPLEGMTKLMSLNAENNRIVDLTPLQSMKDLSMLNLRSNFVHDLEPLRSLTKIQNLYLDDNRIWNIEPLHNHTFDTHYDTGALLYGLTLTGNYLDLRDSTKSYRLLQQLAGDGHPLNQRAMQRFTIGSTTAFAGESSVKLDPAPFLHQNRTYVPIRFVAERLGAKVAWDQRKQEVTIRKGDTAIRWALNGKQAIANGQAVSFDTPLLLKKSTTFVPIRFVSELLGSDVEYIPSSRTILIFEGK